ncbi:MAG: hypothetical protein DRH89_07530 [Candidatus Cloacimonadota bacterium]|nr:MAG: hypothetical protein DRH89_07530 [Candidatus Cloacimonadota bacterium]
MDNEYEKILLPSLLGEGLGMRGKGFILVCKLNLHVQPKLISSTYQQEERSPVKLRMTEKENL